jgi:hypothetical protein
MSNFILEILEPTTNILEVETSFGSIVNNIEIERFDSFNLEIVNTEKVLASDLPDDIPMSKIVGNLNVSRISGLSGYLNQYVFDCGTP